MAQPEIELPILVGQAGPLSGLRWEIDKEIMVGRDPDCDIVIADRQVSRYHARIERQDERVVVEDLGSKNGTYINGNRIEEPAVLSDSDVVQIALVQGFLFLLSDTTMALDTQALPNAALAGIFPPASNKSAPAPRSENRPGSGLYLETQSRRVWVKGQELVPPLSLQQFRLLEALQRHKGQVVTRQELIDEIWGEDEAQGVSEQAFDALVRRLRERLNLLDPDTNYIITVRGHGLRMDQIA